MHACNHVCMYVCVCVDMSLHIRAFVSVCVAVCVEMCIHMWPYTLICVYVRVDTCLYECRRCPGEWLDGVALAARAVARRPGGEGPRCLGRGARPEPVLRAVLWSNVSFVVN